jgi:hypothetical protein
MVVFCKVVVIFKWLLLILLVLHQYALVEAINIQGQALLLHLMHTNILALKVAANIFLVNQQYHWHSISFSRIQLAHFLRAHWCLLLELAQPKEQLTLNLLPAFRELDPLSKLYFKWIRLLLFQDHFTWVALLQQ